MSRSSKQRRDARRRRGRPVAGPPRGPSARERHGASWTDVASEPAPEPPPDPQRVARSVRFEVAVLAGQRTISDADATKAVWRLERLVPSATAVDLGAAIAATLTGLITDLADGGWGPGDLARLVRRNVDARHLPLLASLLHDDARRHQRRGQTWRDAIEAIGSSDPLRLESRDELAAGLWVAALLSITPVLATDAFGETATTAPVAEHPRLARVRALLAKAESTEFDEEAEALSAKAQELITRHALDQLVAQAERSAGGESPGVRRFWLDAPYVGAKAALVHEVASANRCRSAVSERLGYCVLVGTVADLDAVELLVTSLLVQADTAMLRQGRRVDRAGRSRTRSFRQSFLLGYAVRIGERLRAVTEAATQEQGASMLPVLHDHEERVAAAFQALVPTTVRRSREISHGEGWVAGAAAADLAQLDVRERITDRAR